MSDSESDEESYCYYGKALEPYDEDAFPKKRPITVEEQVATDAQGRRRFHGAFTGGFSAGFFNTVGSLEGWTPSEFKSSRSEKAAKKQQKPEDYMDDEDIGEFGIAPQVVRATKEFANKNKRKKQSYIDGPIPGEPVLQTLLSSGNETVGYLLLRNMGLKDRNEQENNIEESAGPKVYGCEMPKVAEENKPYECAQYPIAEIYKDFFNAPKSNTFGLGYSGLQTSHINLFESTSFVVREGNNKKLSISGQAFGVGAFENDDEDIYGKDNMSKYDFELTNEVTPKDQSSKKDNSANTVFDKFVLSKDRLNCSEHYPPPVIPHSFTGKHKVRKSRFEPLPEENESIERNQINATIRARYLGEEQTIIPTPSGQEHSKSSHNISTNQIIKEEKSDSDPTNSSSILAGFSNILVDKFVSAKQDDSQDILEPVKKSVIEHGTKEMRDAAALKMFGPLTRISYDWQPCSLLCKRFNVVEPLAGDNPQKKKRTKHLIFEYQKEVDDVPLHKPGLSVQTIKSEDDAETQHTEDISSTSCDIIDESSTSEVRDSELKPVNSSNTEKEKESENPAPLDITEKVDVAKNTDLFKAIFLSSSESESEEEADKSVEDRSIALKTNILTDQLIPKIKTNKEGILSNIDFSQLTSPMEEEHKEKQPESAIADKQCDDPSLYGPKLPDKINNTNNKVHSTQHIEENISEWVEKDDTERKKSNKHKKKHKKEKHRHKSKHKHKDTSNRK